MVSWNLPLLLLIVYGSICFAGVFVNQRLVSRFRTKRPDLVAKYLPEASDRLAHPKKLVFFLKPSTAKILADDQELLRLRNRLVWLVVCIPVFLIVTAVLMVLVVTLKLF